MCPQLKKRGDDSKRPALLHEGVPTAIQSKGFERFPGKPMLLPGEAGGRQGRGIPERKSRTPTAPPRHFFRGGGGSTHVGLGAGRQCG